MSFDVDFSPIGNLAKTHNEARTKAVRERTLAELGQHFANGSTDYRGLGAKLFALGEPRSGFAALQAADLRDEMWRRLNAPGAPQRQPAMAPPAAVQRQTPMAPRPLWPYGGMPFAPGNPYDGASYAPATEWPKLKQYPEE
jgi:hypothetical protein